MLCELRAMADGNGCLHLCVGANGANWLHYIWRGAELTVCTAHGERQLSSRAAIKLMLRELWLQESAVSAQTERERGRSESPR